jgi:hypothetical protein
VLVRVCRRRRSDSCRVYPGSAGDARETAGLPIARGRYLSGPFFLRTRYTAGAWVKAGRRTAAARYPVGLCTYTRHRTGGTEGNAPGERFGGKEEKRLEGTGNGRVPVPVSWGLCSVELERAGSGCHRHELQDRRG